MCRVIAVDNRVSFLLLNLVDIIYWVAFTFHRYSVPMISAHHHDYEHEHGVFRHSFLQRTPTTHVTHSHTRLGRVVVGRWANEMNAKKFYFETARCVCVWRAYIVPCNLFSMLLSFNVTLWSKSHGEREQKSGPLGWFWLWRQLKKVLISSELPIYCGIGV